MTNAMQTTRTQDQQLEQRAARRTIAPPADVFENDDEYLIYADLPGIEEDSLDITIDGDVLSILGKAPEPTASSAGLSVDYRRQFTVPREIDADKVSAALSAGVLTLRLPKSEAVKPRRIAVRSG